MPCRRPPFSSKWQLNCRLSLVYSRTELAPARTWRVTCGKTKSNNINMENQQNNLTTKHNKWCFDLPTQVTTSTRGTTQQQNSHFLRLQQHSFQFGHSNTFREFPLQFSQYRLLFKNVHQYPYVYVYTIHCNTSACVCIVHVRKTSS